MKENILKIIKHYGVRNQLKKLNEECYELQEAIIEYSYVEVYKGSPAEKHHKEHVVEEIADVCVMLHQFVEYYRITPVEIYRFMEQKIGRQIERIEKEGK